MSICLAVLPRHSSIRSVQVDAVHAPGWTISSSVSKRKVERMIPEHVYKNTQGEDVSVVALEALGYMDQLFNSPTSVTWNKETLNLFKNRLPVRCGVEVSSGDGGLVTSANASMKTYLDKLNTVLKQKAITWMSAFLCLAQVCSMPMPCHLQGELVRTTHNLLRDMGGHFHLECLQENVFMTFPAAAFATSGTPQLSSSGAKAIYDTLKNIDSLFGADDLPTKWDQQKLENFQNIIYRQIEESKCMMGSVDTSDYPIRAEGLKTYFGKIAAVLKEKNFSYCAWEVVRKELLYTLQFILKHNSDSLLHSSIRSVQGEDVSVVALEALGYMDQLFNSLTSVTWNKETLSLFKNRLPVRCGVGASFGDGELVTSGNASMKTYFNKLNTVLKHKAITWMSAFLCLAQVCSMPMPCHLQGQLVRTTHNLLRDMGGHFPLECLQQNVFLAFPAAAFATSGAPQLSSSGAKAIYDTLKNIDSLFGADDLPTKWDQQKLENFQNIIYRQIEESKCMMGSVDTSDYPIRAEGLKTYFGKIAAVLKEKNFSYCAWEVVRKELLYTLQFILKHNSDSLLHCCIRSMQVDPGEDVSVFALEAMGYVAQLFNNSVTAVTENNKQLNLFKNILSRSLLCSLEVGGGVGASSGDGGSVTEANASLKTYFDKLNTVLKQKENSTCAWEMVREEVPDNLVQFNKFLDSRVKPSSKNCTSDYNLDERLPLPRASLLHGHALPAAITAVANNPQPTERHGTFPLECLQDNVFMAFPATAFANSCATGNHMGSYPSLSSSGSKSIYETLKNIDSLFGADDLPTM
ncbi:unnamed protein product [Coregonus sp. 'balchen']|nr:unnamed protein product [Coregonus sp. 'balchen']